MLIPPLATAFLMIPKLAARIAAIDDKDRGEVRQHKYCDVECYVHLIALPVNFFVAIFKSAFKLDRRHPFGYFDLTCGNKWIEY